MVAYKINETLVKNIEREDNGIGCSGVVIVTLTLVITIGNITWAVFQYIWFHDCGYNNVLITVTCVASLVFYGIVFFRTREDASVFTSTIVVLYILYLQWSALASNPNEQCNQFKESETNTIMQLMSGLIFTFISLFIISASTKKNDEKNITA